MDRTIRVLFVEDSPFDVKLECRQLEREQLDFEWQAVASEPEMRKALETFHPDVVLSDFSMPGFSGLAALKIMRASAPHIPLIFVSGTIGEELAVRCLREGATDYILKGNLSRLGSSVRRALEEVEQNRKVQETEQARARLVEILEATPDIVATTGPDGRITYMNEAGCRLLGVSEDEVIGRPAKSFYSSRTRELISGEAIPAAMDQGAWQGETALLTRSGAEIPVSQVIVAHKTASGTAKFLSGIARDVRERKTFEAQIYHLAHHDPITGLPNRSMLGDRASQALVHARRSGRSAALLAIHIDNFALVDEGLGHAAGEGLLAEIGARIRAAVREDDTVARLAADEFAVLLADLARTEDAHAVARKILAALAPPLSAGELRMRVTASIGAAVHPEDGNEFDALMRNAGAAMRRVAAQGRGGFQYYASGMTSESLDRLAMEAGLQAALERRELMLYYQPQFDIRTQKLLGVEALMRWPAADGSMISPARFIPVAEESGLIRALGEWALLEACTTVLGWSEAERPPVRVAVNVSPHQLSIGGFAETVERVLETTGFPADLLEIEITEGALIGGGNAPEAALRRIKLLGVTVSVDDFGTGYSSLSYLSRLPIDRLKVDRSFVRRMVDDSRDAAIVRAIVSLGHGLGLAVVAEGVETRAQLAMLAEMGCDEAQGYLLAQPSAGDAIRSMLGLSHPATAERG
jgi:diguanylate cyclase (GGDEF)-like protein/PAS domain S-box-containing protein